MPLPSRSRPSAPAGLHRAVLALAAALLFPPAVTQASEAVPRAVAAPPAPAAQAHGAQLGPAGNVSRVDSAARPRADSGGDCAAEVANTRTGAMPDRVEGIDGTFNAVAIGLDTPREVILEVAQDGIWAPIWAVSLGTDAPGSAARWSSAVLAYPAAYAYGTQTFRFVLAATVSCAATSSAAFTQVFRRAQYAFDPALDEASGANAITAATSATVTLTGLAEAEVLEGRVRTSSFVVQRSVDAGPWTVRRDIVVGEQADTRRPGRVTLTATIPALTSKNAHKIDYRFAAEDNATVLAGASPALRVEYFNPRREFTQAYTSRCPSSKIVYTDNFSPSLSPNAVAFYTWGRTNIVGVKQSWLQTAALERIRFVAYHECGHRLQHVTYRNLGEAEAAAAKAFGSHPQPIEHWADCIAAARLPANETLGYGGTCTAKELKYAAKTLKKRKLF